MSQYRPHPWQHALNYVWSVSLLDWVAEQQPLVSGITIGTVDQGTPAAVANAWPIKVTDGSKTADVMNLGVQPTDANNALMTMSMIHGHTTAGGGSYVDVKVNPSGALTVDASGSPGVTIAGQPLLVIAL